jgi:hypothetical protein
MARKRGGKSVRGWPSLIVLKWKWENGVAEVLGYRAETQGRLPPGPIIRPIGYVWGLGSNVMSVVGGRYPGSPKTHQVGQKEWTTC